MTTSYTSLMAEGRTRRAAKRLLRWLWVPLVAVVLVVAVAMACAVWSPEKGTNTIIIDGTFLRYEKPASLRGYKGNYEFGGERIGFGMSMIPIVEYHAVIEKGEKRWDPRMIIVGRSGFPFLCMRWTDDDASSADEALTFSGGIEIQSNRDSQYFGRRIPLIPEPIGMALNILIYSAAILLTCLSWRRVVVIRRKRKNLCLKCAYPLGEFTICPECGNRTIPY